MVEQNIYDAIYVQHFGGRIIPFEATIKQLETMTVVQLMLMYQDKEGLPGMVILPEAQQKMIFRGVILNKNKLLSQYNITYDSVIHVII